jgi:hypothetical protein
MPHRGEQKWLFEELSWGSNGLTQSDSVGGVRK